MVLAQCLEDIPTDLRGLVRPILYQAEGLGVATLMEQLKDQLQIVRAETVTENMLVPLKDTRTEPMPGVIVLVEKERAVVEAGRRARAAPGAGQRRRRLRADHPGHDPQVSPWAAG